MLIYFIEIECKIVIFCIATKETLNINTHIYIGENNVYIYTHAQYP